MFVLHVAAPFGLFSSNPIAALALVPVEEITGIIFTFTGFIANSGTKYFHFLIMSCCVLLVAALLGMFRSSNPITAFVHLPFEEIMRLIFTFTTAWTF